MTACLPKANTVCSLSLLPPAEYPLQPGQPSSKLTKAPLHDSCDILDPCSSAAGPNYLTITRCHASSCPLLLYISLPPTADESSQLSATCEGQTQPLGSCMEDPCAPPGSNGLHVPIHSMKGACQVPIYAVREFESILADSAASMKADVAPMTSADKTAWWRQRMALDQRMADLLKHLDLAWLGPWR